MTDAADRLAALREEELRRVADLRAELADVLDSASSTTGDDEHDPEGATIGLERAQAQALLDAATAHLEEIDAAQARVAAGTYGTCTRCGRPIGDERLAARPAAPLCITCASHP